MSRLFSYAHVIVITMSHLLSYVHVVVTAGYTEGSDYAVAAEEYGYHLGMAYQIVDDILDFTGAT